MQLQLHEYLRQTQERLADKSDDELLEYFKKHKSESLFNFYQRYPNVEARKLYEKKNGLTINLIGTTHGDFHMPSSFTPFTEMYMKDGSYENLKLLSADPDDPNYFLYRGFRIAKQRKLI